MKHPIDSVSWVDDFSLRANLYNPNVVFTPELKLLEHSIVRNGWLFPIIANGTGIIIDGFHRWTLAKESKRIRKRDDGMVPRVVVDCTDDDAMLMTVRMNRARGSHVAYRLADMVQKLHGKYHMAPETIAKGIGATKAEIELLLAPSVFEARDLKNAPYSRAWYPRETNASAD